MWSRNQRQRMAHLLLRRVGMLALLALVFFASASVWEVYEKERESRKLRVQAEAEWIDLTERQGKLSKSLAELRTDRGLEEALREQYAFAEHGEGLIVIVEPPAPPSIEATTTLQGWFRRTFEWF